MIVEKKTGERIKHEQLLDARVSVSLCVVVVLFSFMHPSLPHSFRTPSSRRLSYFSVFPS